MTDSILQTVKTGLGITDESCEDFDGQLITHINTAFFVLHQLGVGPATPFEITGASETWSDFDSEVSKYAGIKTYLIQKVKIVFDPPQGGSAMEALKSSIAELESRLNWHADY